jgi:nucleotide-binding universal stress UspA family protein
MTSKARKRILVGTSGTAGSAEAVEVAVSLARAQGADLTFVHVVPTINGSTPADDAALRDAAERARARGVEASIELAAGDASATLLARAESLGADLIVVGPSGRKLLTPHVSQAVSRRARRPVLVVRGIDVRAAA